MLMKLIKHIGQPICILLYVISAYFAFKKKFIPLVALVATHLSEFFIIGRKTGEEHGLGKASSFLRCMAFGFTWWLPIRKG